MMSDIRSTHRRFRSHRRGGVPRFVRVFITFLGVVAFSVPAAAAEDIHLGMSTALSGPAGELGINMRDGVLAGLERGNRTGGIGGRRFRLTVLDDGYEPIRTAPNMRHLIMDQKVLTIIGNVGTPTAIAAIPIAVEQKTLFYGAFTGASVLRKHPPDRYVINYRASYAEEVGAMIDALVAVAGLRLDQIAFFTQRDGYGDAGFAGGVAALRRHGLEDVNTVMHTRYERNTLAVEHAVANILLAQPAPRAIIMVGAYSPCAKFIRVARQSGIKAVFLNVSFTGGAPLARLLASHPAPVIVTQVVPHPLGNTPLAKDYRHDLKQFAAGNVVPTFGGFEGYIAATILIRAIGRITGDITRESVIDALESMGRFDIGIGEPLTLNPEAHQASHRVWPTVLRRGTFVPFDWKDLPTIMPGEG